MNLRDLFKSRRKADHVDEELEEFRAIMDAPEECTEGFSVSSLVACLFIGLVMVPGTMYMELVAGMGMGGASTWVTVLLFVEVAKRANTTLNRAQLFILFYLSGMVMGATGGPLFTQYLVRSDAAVAYGLSTQFPNWVAPSNLDELPRTFLHAAWMPAVGLMLFGSVFGMFTNMVLTYALFKVVSDIERLPFPMAPLAAQGIVAISEQVEGTGASKAGTNVRWRLFCMGAGLGLIFGVLYMVVPVVSGALLGQTVMVFPIPFVEFTQYTQKVLPAVATGLSWDIGGMIGGMVMPWFAMLGSFIGLVVTIIANPILHAYGQLPTWQEGHNTVLTLFDNNIDFYFSFGIGVSLAIAIYGFFTVWRAVRERKRAGSAPVRPEGVPKNRGDIRWRWVFITYLVGTAAYIFVSGLLIDWHPGVMIVLFFFGFVYTPIISYVTAKLEGLAGEAVEIPFIRELSFILSGYKGIAIWFLPVPKANYGGGTVFYKQAELLGCRFTSIWKSQIILFPIIFICMLLFGSFIWGLGEIPSGLYPYTARMWPLGAKNACLMYTATLDEFSPFREALVLWKVLLGLSIGGVLLIAFDFFAAPIMLLFGVVRGLGQTMPHGVIPNFIGALIGKFYFQKKYGREWRKMIPIFAAGFGVGGGLISVVAVGIVFLSKAITTVEY
jgi:hypothetical protein